MTLDPSTPAKHDVVDERASRASFWQRFRASALYDPATRVVHSIWQVGLARLAPVFAVLAATGGLGTDQLGPVLLAALYAGLGAGVAAAALSLLTWPVPKLPRAADTVVRLLRTAAGAVFGQFAASLAIDDQALVHFGWTVSIATAVGAALLSLTKTQLVNAAMGIGGAFSGAQGVAYDGTPRA